MDTMDEVLVEHGLTRSKGHETCHHRIYTMSCVEYERLLERAAGHCELCDVDVAATPRGSLVIDHDGRYGWPAVRGLICDKCNAHMRRVDAGERPDDSDVREYRHRAWFIEMSAQRGGSSPIRTWESPDWQMWRRFRDIAGIYRYAVLRQLVAAYCGERRDYPTPHPAKGTRKAAK